MPLSTESDTAGDPKPCSGGAGRPAGNRREPGGAYAPRPSRSLGLVFFPAFDWAISPDHPEREERLLYTRDQLREEGLFDIPGISEHRPLLAGWDDAARAHFCPPGFDKVVETPHLISAGGAIKAASLVMDGLTDKAFALVRPPGHHAMRVIQGGRGFCALNIEAVMIERLRHDYGARRIAIVDTDCHHGDGTQDIYWHDPDTLFISLHQDGRTLYPGSGFLEENGGPLARGSTVNIPLPPGTGDAGFLLAVKEIVRPILDMWKPDLVINSAGQDNHFSDPITNMRLSARGYARMVESINADVAVLEGGYSIQGALPYVNLAVILAMAGLDYSRVVEPLWKEELAATGDQAMEHIRKLGEAVLALYRKPDSIPHGYRAERGFWVREREIYYDTDGISEEQREELKACGNCPGLLLIRTRAASRPWSLCVHLPRTACAACRAAAEKSLAEAAKNCLPSEYHDASADQGK